MERCRCCLRASGTRCGDVLLMMLLLLLLLLLLVLVVEGCCCQGRSRPGAGGARTCWAGAGAPGRRGETGAQGNMPGR